MARWRRLTQNHHQFNSIGIECGDLCCALRTAHQANANGLPQNGFELLANVIGSAAHQAHLIGTDPSVVRLKQDQIHGASRSVRMETA
jgi:hypothetical protein